MDFQRCTYSSSIPGTDDSPLRLALNDLVCATKQRTTQLLSVVFGSFKISRCRRWYDVIAWYTYTLPSLTSGRARHRPHCRTRSACTIGALHVPRSSRPRRAERTRRALSRGERERSTPTPVKCRVSRGGGAKGFVSLEAFVCFVLFCFGSFSVRFGLVWFGLVWFGLLFETFYCRLVWCECGARGKVGKRRDILK